MGKSSGLGVPEDILRELREFSADHNATIEDLLTPEFMKANTDFASFDEFTASLGNVAETSETPQDAVDSCVVEHSHFSSYNAMLWAALAARTKECR
jgi:hypothetical protein